MTWTWIECALSAGGILTVKTIIHGRRIFRATMTWPNEKPPVEPIQSEIKMSVQDALTDLNEKLLEDAAQEMIDAGAV